jgi:hypothetical protein
VRVLSTVSLSSTVQVVLLYNVGGTQNPDTYRAGFEYRCVMRTSVRVRTFEKKERSSKTYHHVVSCRKQRSTIDDNKKATRRVKINTKHCCMNKVSANDLLSLEKAMTHHLIVVKYPFFTSWIHPVSYRYETRLNRF